MDTITAVNLTNPEVRKVVADILSQAITGELIGMSNFASLAETVSDVEEKMEAVEHAESERQHALGFQRIAEKHELPTIINLDGIYWKTMREEFLKNARNKDFIACLIIQEIMLESFAVSMYKDAGEAIGGEIGELLLKTSREEEEHLEHSIEILEAEWKRDGEQFVKKFHQLHLDCMTVLSEWSAKEDKRGHCGVCNGNCMKEDLGAIGLSSTQMRGNALKTYATALDEIGLPTEQTTVWIVNLPA